MPAAGHALGGLFSGLPGPLGRVPVCSYAEGGSERAWAFTECVWSVMCVRHGSDAEKGLILVFSVSVRTQCASEPAF